jgi:integrase
LRPIRVTIGAYPLTPLADAREKAREALRDLAAGIDPRRVARAKAVTFGVVAEEFIKRHASRKRSARNIELLIRRELIPRWGDRPIGDVTRRDVVNLMNEIIDRGHPAAAHQAFGYGKRIFSWALALDTYDLEASPFDRLKRGDLLGAKRSRTRLLSSPELALIWQATDGAPEAVYPDGPFIRLLLLLATRRGELAGARWSEFDLDAARWVIPGARMKNGDPHLVPLPPAAVAILQSLPRFAGCEFVFSARGNMALNDFCGLKARLDARIAALNGASRSRRGSCTIQGAAFAPVCQSCGSSPSWPNWSWRTGSAASPRSMTCTITSAKSAKLLRHGRRGCWRSSHPTSCHCCGKQADMPRRIAERGNVG